MTVSLAQGGEGLGAMWGREKALELLSAAGFQHVEIHRFEHDVSPWLNYFWGVLLRAYGELEDRVGTLLGGKGAKTEQIKQAVSQKITPCAISDIEADCPGVSRDMIRLVLRSLRDEGKIQLRGKGRGAKWIKVP
jgi:hypothetical protein